MLMLLLSEREGLWRDIDAGLKSGESKGSHPCEADLAGGVCGSAENASSIPAVAVIYKPCCELNAPEPR